MSPLLPLNKIHLVHAIHYLTIFERSLHHQIIYHSILILNLFSHIHSQIYPYHLLSLILIYMLFLYKIILTFFSDLPLILSKFMNINQMF